MRQRLASFDTTVTVIFFLVMFSSACLIPVQSDTWWHLRAGQEMWTRHVVMQGYLRTVSPSRPFQVSLVVLWVPGASQKSCAIF